MIKTLVLVTIITISIITSQSVFGQSQDKIPYKQLSWSDFKGEVEITGPKKDFAAKMSWWLGGNWNFKETDSSICEYKFTNVNAVASFRPFDAWVKQDFKDNFDLLKHEQGHLDIAEIHARGIESELLGKRFFCPGGVFNIDKINEVTSQVFQEYRNSTREMDQLYDTETNRSKNKQEQADWNEKIGCMLQNRGPSSYCLSLKTLTTASSKTVPTIDNSKIPGWVKNIFLWYDQEKISEDEFLSAIQFLLDQEILKSKS